MSYLTYNPDTTSYPIRAFSNPYRVASPDAIGGAYLYWQIAFNGNLSEIQYNDGLGAKTFTSANGATITGTNFVTSFSTAISDGAFSGAWGTNTSNTPCTLNIEFDTITAIEKILYYPQVSGTTIYNFPGSMSIYYSENGVDYTLRKTQQVSTTGDNMGSSTLAAQGLAQGVMKVINLT